MRPSSESPILDSTGLWRVGHDKRGGAADQDQNARDALSWPDVTGRYATRHTLRISLRQIWMAQYAFLYIHGMHACMEHASCMHVSFTRPPALRARQYVDVKT